MILLAAAGCGRAERERLAAVDSAQAATLAAVEQALTETIRRADRLAGSADRILSPRPVMTPGQEEALRRFQNGVHVARARELGVRITSEAVLDSLLEAGRLIELEDSTEHWIVRRGASPAYVLPHVRSTITSAWKRAGIADVTGIDGIETHDCFTTSEYMAIDHFGITEPGESWKAIEAGWLEIDGEFPINPSGGLIGAGHPVGATGVRQLLDAALQVTGQAGDYQVEGARNFQTLNIGGSGTTSVSFVVGV